MNGWGLIVAERVRSGTGVVHEVAAILREVYFRVACNHRNAFWNNRVTYHHLWEPTEEAVTCRKCLRIIELRGGE